MENKKQVIKELVPYIIILILVILIKQFIVTTVMVQGTSMIPTLQDGDVMILNRLAYTKKEIKRFDIVVINDHETLILRN